MVTARWARVRDALIVTAIAIVVFQGLCRFVGDYYRVPTRSMEPLLHGDPDDGDVVWVDVWSSGADCGHGDVVVVQSPEDPAGQLVKRIVACGDNPDQRWIEISEGDLWLGENSQLLERVTKEPAAARALRVQWAGWSAARTNASAPLALEAADQARDELTVPPLALDRPALRAACHPGDDAGAWSGFIGTAEAVDATYLDVLGRRGAEGEDVQIYDCGLDLQMVAPVEELVVILETRHETFAFIWRASSGEVELWRNGVDVATATLTVRPSGAHRIECGRLDDRLFFIVDGRDDSTFVEPRRREWNQPREALPRGPRSRLFFGALGPGELRIASLRVFRDVYYYRDRITGRPGTPQLWPREVPKGHWFLLGDNAFDSRDSRHFGAIPVTSYLGRPRLVLGPYPRSRWLEP